MLEEVSGPPPDGAGTPQAQVLSSAEPEGQVVLVVDDNEAFRYSVGRALSAHGYRVLEASNGDEALDVISDHEVTILLLDLVMPGLNGVELLRVLSRRKARRPMRVIVCSGKRPITEESEQFLASVGVTDCLDKPFTNEQLLQTIKG